MAWDVMSGVTKTAWDVMSGVTKQHGMFCPGWQIFVGCFVGVSKNGMGCFVPGCFVRLPRILHSLNLVTVKSCSKGLICKMCNTCRCRSRLSGKEASMYKDLREGVCFADFISFLLNIL